jgi:hypothetical protein
MFVARSLPYSGAPERRFKWVGSYITRKHYTRLENLARDKRSSLLRKSVNYGRKKFFSTGPSLLQTLINNGRKKFYNTVRRTSETAWQTPLVKFLLFKNSILLNFIYIEDLPFQKQW